MLYSTGTYLMGSLTNLWIGVITYLPMIIIAFIIVALGFLIGGLIGKGISALINAAHVDSLFEKMGVMNVFRKMSVNWNSGKMIGGLVKWLVVIAFFITALGVLGLDTITMFLSQIVMTFIPSVIIAAIILIAGSVIAEFVFKTVRGSARAADMHASNFAASVAKWAIMIFAIMMALSQLGIGAQFVQIIFMGIIAMLALAGGLAFGLGGRDHAGRVLSDVSAMIKRD